MAATSGKQAVQIRPEVSERVRKEVERELPVYSQLSEDELLAKVGEIPASASGALYKQENYFDFPDLRALGAAFLKDRVRPIVCDPDNQKAIGDALSKENVTALVTLLLPIFGLGLATGAVVAISVLVLKIGMREFCKDFTVQ